MTILWREVQNHVTSPEVINISGTPISAPFPDQPSDTLELSSAFVHSVHRVLFVPRSATKNLSKVVVRAVLHSQTSAWGCDYTYLHYTLTKHKQVTFLHFLGGGGTFFTSK